MEIKCNFHSNLTNYGYALLPNRAVEFRGKKEVLLREVGESADKFVRGPVATKSATGPRGFGNGLKKAVNSVKSGLRTYKNNIVRTYQHKIVFAMVEKELFGKNSIDSITHDLDKLILYTLGLPKSFVSKFHRRHSEHHAESGKKLNLRSMLCDNVASSPEFKPEKKFSLRDYYQKSNELQEVKGFGELLEKYSYGENIDFDKIKLAKTYRYSGLVGILTGAIEVIHKLFL